jgi:hypothetical protein
MSKKGQILEITGLVSGLMNLINHIDRKDMTEEQILTTYKKLFEVHEPEVE